MSSFKEKIRFTRGRNVSYKTVKRSELYSPFIFVFVLTDGWVTVIVKQLCTAPSEGMRGVQLSICILIRNVIFSVGYLQISNKMYYLFFLLFLFVLEYISVHHNLPVVHNVLSLKYLFLYQILKWERIIPPTATDSYKKNVRFSIQ